jgi:sterol desaturase/sphingolipid hydroxylase (fatty acid hydroxylase superfamily)/CDGSH-type Zn-finger protein
MVQVFNFLAQHSMMLVMAVLFGFGIMEAIFGYAANSKRSKDDVLVETVNTFILMVITKPLVTLGGFYLMQLLFPSAKDSVADWPLWASILVAILVDDFLQYWYHRSSHEYKWLWKWHRPHHVAEEMGFLVSYREAMWFYVFMPNIWWMGMFTYLGGGLGVAAGLVLKQLVVISSHSLLTWDSFFYNRPKLMPIMKVLERIFITPAFHHGHHAVSIVDDIGNPNGNFGNMFSFWDQLFGSAKFTHQFPTKYGLETDLKDDWKAHVFYPLITSDKQGSEISKDFKFEKTTVLEPAVLTLKEGDYLYCQCGFSKNQPFCDGSHHGTKIQPMKFTIKKEREYKLCNCKLCAKGPFCDNSHLKVDKL